MADKCKCKGLVKIFGTETACKCNCKGCKALKRCKNDTWPDKDYCSTCA